MQDDNSKTMIPIPSRGTIEVIDLKLPPGSTCIDMAAANDYIIAIFDIPNRGLIPFKIYPDLKQVFEVELTKENFAEDMQITFV